MLDISDIHIAVNEKIFAQLILDFKNKYCKKYNKMYLYIEDQWFKGSFTNWQIFRNPPGFAE